MPEATIPPGPLSFQRLAPIAEDQAANDLYGTASDHGRGSRLADMGVESRNSTQARNNRHTVALGHARFAIAGSRI